MKKVGILFPYLRDAGNCRVAAIQSVMFYEAGYQVDVIVRDNNAIFNYSGNLIDLRVRSRGGVFKLVTYLELYLKVRRVKKNDYDYFISHAVHCDFINVVTKQSEHVITTIHGNIHKKYSKIALYFLKYIISFSDRVVAVSRQIADDVRKEFPVTKSKVEHIYNPVDLDAIKKSCREEVTESIPGEFIVSVGRLSIEKAQWHLIKAFSVISNDFPLLELVVIGEGKLKGKLQKLARNLGVSERIKFKGFVNNPHKYIKHAELLVMTSLYEGFPMVAIEAMAIGVPVLASDFKSGAREIIAPEKEIDEKLDYQSGFSYGYLIPDFANLDDFRRMEVGEGEQLLAESLRKVLSQPDSLHLFKEKGKKRVVSLSKECILKEWEKVFESIEAEVVS